MKKRIVSIFLTVAMVFGLLPQITMPVQATGETPVASVTTTSNGVTNYTTLLDAFQFAASSNGSTLKLLDNVDLGNVNGGASGITVLNGNFTLNLNNFHITASTTTSGATCSTIKLSTGATLTIEDSSSVGGGYIDFLYKGTVSNGNVSGSGLHISGGTVNLESGAIFGANEAVIINVAGSKLNMSGGVIYGKNDYTNCEAIAIDTAGAQSSTIITISGGYLGRLNKAADLIWAPNNSVSNVGWNITGGYFDSNKITEFAKLANGYSLKTLPQGVKNAITRDNVYEYEVIVDTNKFAQVVTYTDNLVSTAGGTAFVGTTNSSVTEKNVLVTSGNTAYYAATAASDYTFDGWYNAAIFSTQNRISVEPQYSQTITADTVLYARFIQKPATYSVSFDMQGHGTQVAPQTISSGNKVTIPTKPTETGYTFGGWYKESTCNTEWKFDTDTVTSNTILSAMWKSQACDITEFSINSPAVSGTINGTNISLTVPFDTNVTALAPTIKVSEKASVSPTSGVAQSFKNPVTYTVTGEDGITKKTYTVKVEIAQDPDIAIINKSKIDAESATYLDMDQEVALNETIIANAIKNTATLAINDSTVEVTTNKSSYITPTAGTKENPNGTNGSYAFTITVKKDKQQQTTAQKTITIIATPYEAIPTYSVSVTVKDFSGTLLNKANVKLIQGNKEKGSTDTGINGVFKIKGISNGTYNLVITKGETTITTIVVVDKENYTIKDPIILPNGNQNSVVDIKAGTPSVVVGGLNELFDKTTDKDDKGLTLNDKAVITGGGSVQIKLVAEGKGKDAPNANVISAKASSNAKTIGMYIDLSVQKTVKQSGIDDKITSLVELQDFLQVFITLPTELQKQQNYVIYRYHDGKVDVINEDDNGQGEKIELIDGDTTIKLTTKKFSTYAIAYKDTTNSGGTTGGSKGGTTHNFSAIENLIIDLPPAEDFKKTNMAAFEKVEKEYNKLTNDEKTIIDEFLHNKYKAIAKQAETMRKSAEKPAIVKPKPVIAPKPKPISVPKTGDTTPVGLPITFATLGLMLIALELLLKVKGKQKS